HPGVRGHDVDDFNNVGNEPMGHSQLATGMSRLIANLGRRTNEPTLTFLCHKQCQLPLLRLGFERGFPMNVASSVSTNKEYRAIVCSAQPAHNGRGVETPPKTELDNCARTQTGRREIDQDAYKIDRLGMPPFDMRSRRLALAAKGT
ncbi:11521_t:CDS:2, partial [Acaulospora colombiana]